MITKSKKAPGTVFYVPNCETGQRFLLMLDRFLNKGEYKVRVKGRNEDRAKVAQETGMSHHGLRQSVPMRHATYLAVYLDGKTTLRLSQDRYEELCNRSNRSQTRNFDLEKQLHDETTRAHELNLEVFRLKGERDHVQRTIAQPPSWAGLWKTFQVLVARSFQRKP